MAKGCLSRHLGFCLHLGKKRSKTGKIMPKQIKNLLRTEKEILSADIARTDGSGHPTTEKGFSQDDLQTDGDHHKKWPLAP